MTRFKGNFEKEMVSSLQNKVVQKMKSIRNVNNMNCSPNSIFLKNQFLMKLNGHENQNLAIFASFALLHFQRKF